jgi:hypothetical protein
MKEEDKVAMISSAATTTVSMVYENAAEKKWNAQRMKVSAKDLCKED